MENQLKGPTWELPPPAIVEYSPEGQVLIIETGQKSEVGEDIAENIIVHYEKDDDAFSSVVAIRIDSAEHVLKPFVDAILAKYGLTRDVEREQFKDSEKEEDAVLGD